jgi:hypothetical protein
LICVGVALGIIGGLGLATTGDVAIGLSATALSVGVLLTFLYFKRHFANPYY